MKTVSSCHVTYAFRSESTLYICLNVKEFLAQNRQDIWSLSDCKGTRTHNHLVCKGTLNHLELFYLSNNWFRKLVSSLSIIFGDHLKVTSVPFSVANLNLSSCKFHSFRFTLLLLYWVLLCWYYIRVKSY